MGFSISYEISKMTHTMHIIFPVPTMYVPNIFHIKVKQQFVMLVCQIYQIKQ